MFISILVTQIVETTKIVKQKEQHLKVLSVIYQQKTPTTLPIHIMKTSTNQSMLLLPLRKMLMHNQIFDHRKTITPITDIKLTETNCTIVHPVMTFQGKLCDKILHRTEQLKGGPICIWILIRTGQDTQLPLDHIVKEGSDKNRFKFTLS